MLFDIFLLLVFFLVYQFAGIFFATAVLVMGSVSLLLSSIVLRERLSLSTMVTLLVVLVFGSATLFFHNARFIQWKPSIIYWLFGLFLLFVPLCFKRNPIRLLVTRLSNEEGSQLQLPDSVWAYINNSYAVFFLLLGCLNIIIVYTCTEKVWVMFKVYGLLPITILFVVLQALSVYFYMKKCSKSVRH